MLNFKLVLHLASGTWHVVSMNLRAIKPEGRATRYLRERSERLGVKLRCIVIVMDGVGAGALPDAPTYKDEGSNTLGNVAKAVGGLNLPNLGRLGLGNIIDLAGVKPESSPQSAFGKCAEVSAGKDTMTGHWEMMGVKLNKPFPTYPSGFGADILVPFEKAIGTKVIGNKAASGTDIMAELGDEHVKTGNPIIYTSADSVFQIAAHKEVISLERLYEICRIASEQLLKEPKVARVIARPFIGKSGAYVRTPERRDFTITPPQNNLDCIVESGLDVMAIGKIAEIFAGRGITECFHGKNNLDNIEATCGYMNSVESGLIFANLSDFDTLWGHRNNVKGFANALSEFDKMLTRITSLLKDDDLLFITADHGCDPTTSSTDHSREYIPLLVTGSKIKEGVNLGTRKTFGDIGQSVADFFGVAGTGIGDSFLKDIWKN